MKTNKLKQQNHFHKQILTSLITTAILAGSFTTKAESEERVAMDWRLKRNVQHIVVIYQENWSFDSLYGQFPGVNGLQNAFDTLPQLDKASDYTNYIYATPQPLRGGPDLRFPPGNGQPALPLIPYDMTKYVSAADTTGDIIHRFYHEQLQIDNGLLEPKLSSMGKFVTWSD